MTMMDTAYDPARPDGENASLTAGVSADGRAETGQRYTVPARCGVAVRLARGQTIRVINTHGTQVCDFWAFCADNLHEHLSMNHLHTALMSIFPKVGDALVSNARRPMLTLVADTSPGIHDTVIACCDHHRYQQLGCTDYHDNCADNLRMALIAIGLAAPAIPAPFNLWMNIPVAPDGRTEWAAPVSRAGDYMDFRAEREVIVVMSACPQDITPVNGAGCTPTDLHFEVTAPLG